jgi:hypothetical protein
MVHNSNDQISKDKEMEGTGVEDTDLQLDDIDDDIIDLVDAVEEEDSSFDEEAPMHEAEAEATDDERVFPLEELDVDGEIRADEPGFNTPIETLEDDEEYEPEVLEGAEGEIEELVLAEDSSFDEEAPIHEAEAEATDEERVFPLEELDMDGEIRADEPGFNTPIETLEDDEEYEPEVLEGAEGKIEEGVLEETTISDTPAVEIDELNATEDQLTDEALAELFSSHETEVAQLLQKATETRGETDETVAGEPPATEGELPEDLYTELSMESEHMTEETITAEEQPVVEEELPEDLFADFETESEAAVEEAVSVEEMPATEEELPEDLFADFETESEAAVEEAVNMEEPSATAEEVPAELFTNLEAESKYEATEALDPAATEAGEAIVPPVAEELATLLSAQVEQVVTRLVTERLPTIVGRAIAEEIEKIKMTLKSEE